MQRSGRAGRPALHQQSWQCKLVEMIAIRCSGLIFDLDGVLIDSTPAVARVWQRWAVAHGRPSRTTIRELLPNADIDRAVLDKEDREVERREMEDLDGVVLLPGAR